MCIFRVRSVGWTAENESLPRVATRMEGSELTVTCVQAAFNLGHTVEVWIPQVMSGGRPAYRETACETWSVYVSIGVSV